MESKTSGWLVAFCLGLVGWLYWDVSPQPIDYEWHSFLVNSSTGQKRTPIEAIDLDRIIAPSAEYVNQTNSIERLFDLMQQNNYLLPNHQIYLDKQQLALSGWPVANQTACGRELTWIHEQLTDTAAAHGQYALIGGKRGRELTQLMDSYGKPEAGLYSGSALTWPGQYDACKQVSLDEDRIRTRYCLAMLRLKPWPAQELGLAKTRIKLGICIPETCDTLSFQSQRERLDSLIKFDLNEFLRENLVLESMYCLPDERSPIRQLTTGGLIFLYALAIWLAIVVCASILRRVLSAQQQQASRASKSNVALAHVTPDKLAASKSLLSSGLIKPSQLAQTTSIPGTQTLFMRIVNALSLQQSWSSFTGNPFAKIKAQAELEGRTIRVDFAQADFFKLLMALFIVLGHSYLVVSLLANSFSKKIDLNLHQLYYLGVNVHKLVDTFFLIFGALAAYTLMRKFTIEQISSPLMWLFVNIGILSRIAPIYLLMYCYAKLVEPYTGEGPWWDYGINKYTPRGMCMESPWWRAIPYLSERNTKPDVGCVQVGWFIVSLVQISLVMPTLIYFLYKLPRHLYRYLLLVFITLISCLEVAIKMKRLTSVRDTAFGTYGVFLIYLLELFEDSGILTPLAKMSGVAWGCHTGYLLHQYEINKIAKWPRWLTRKLTVGLVVGAHVFIMFTPPLGFALAKQLGHTINSYDAFYGNVVAMIVWPVINSLLMIQLTSVYHTTGVCRALGHTFWHTANKLGFSIYLVHWNVITYFTTSYQIGPYESYLIDIAKLTSLGLIVSISIAFLLTILIDIPLSALLALPLRQIQITSNRIAVQYIPTSDGRPKTAITSESSNC